MRTLYEWFAATVQEHGEVAALEIGDTRLTYRELADAAGRLAGHLVRAHGEVPARVGILCSRSVPSYAGYLAALRLGAAAVPLNPGAPPSRNLAIAADAALDVVILDDTSHEQLPDFPAETLATVVDVSRTHWRTLLERRPEPVEARPVGPDDHAYIIFTSGSTGTPKGVPVTHGNVSSYLDTVIKRYEFGPGCRASQTFEISFDGSVIELFASWGSGTTICVPDKSELMTPVKYVRDRELTHWMSVPSVISFARRFDALPPGGMPTLRWSLFGGEPLTVDNARAWAAAAPNSRVENTYGPTELTCTCTGYTSEPGRTEWPETANRSMPIGDIFATLEYALIDEDGQPTDDGELCVRGPQRFPGYLDPANDVDRFGTFDGTRLVSYDGTGPITAEHWYRTGDRIRRENGELVHVGRMDNQVKIRGYRVELEEIEAVLLGHPLVKEAVVLAAPAFNSDVDLHVVYTGELVSDDEFRELVEALPVYMRPRSYQLRQALPLNLNGKIDRRRLADELMAVSS